MRNETVLRKCLLIKTRDCTILPSDIWKSITLSVGYQASPISPFGESKIKMQKIMGY